MRRNLKVALVLNLSTGALANYCLAGQKHKDDLTSLHCIMGTEDAASCASECCESDPKRCGGQSPTCGSESYAGTDFASKHTAVPTGTAAEANKVCCKKKAKCSEALCPDGFIKDPDYSSLFCSSDAASCAQSSYCCKPNMATCGGRVAAGSAYWQTRGDEFKPSTATAKKNGFQKGSFGALTGGTAAPNQLGLVNGLTQQNPAFVPGTDLYYVPKTEKQQTKAWKIKPVKPDGSDTAALCAVKKSNCKEAKYTCPAGLKKPTTAGGATTQLVGASQTSATVYPKLITSGTGFCPSDDASCTVHCCVADTTKCGGVVLPIINAPAGSNYFDKKGTPWKAFTKPCDAATHYLPPLKDLGKWDTSKLKVTDQLAYAKAWAEKTTGSTADSIKSSCCLAKPTCASHTCPAGKKKKAGLIITSRCTTSATCTTDCCQDDTTTCGGLSATIGITCKYGFYNEMDSWGLKTTQAAKDAYNGKVASKINASTACCTPRVACAIPGTSTPAPNAVVVTTTPAAAALKYSEDKIAVEATQSTGANMLWLGVGAVVGMGVLTVVQGVRSQAQPAEQLSEDEDADLLLDSHVE